MKPIFKIVMGLGAICLLAALILYLVNNPATAEPFLIAGIVGLALGVRGVSA
jgi:hypothetical protein